MRILIVEDERQLAEALAEILIKNNYSVDAVYDGRDGLDYALTELYDVILLDIMLPKINGLDVLKGIREKKISTPVLLLTARSEIDDKITGLDCGADDYLTKPFDTGELLARLRAMTRRKGEVTSDQLKVSNTSLNRSTYSLSFCEQAIKLGNKEFQIMEMLMMNKGQIIPKERLIEKIWGYNSDAEYNNVEVYISFIRKKLAAINADISIQATRGVGYSLEVTND